MMTEQAHTYSHIPFDFLNQIQIGIINGSTSSEWRFASTTICPSPSGLKLWLPHVAISQHNLAREI